MRYIAYLLLLYLFLPFNHLIDFIAILAFYILINESGFFSIIFAFFCGLLIDLYHPSFLGTTPLIYLILGQGVIYLKRYLVREPIIISAAFLIFYLLKTLFATLTRVGHLSGVYIFFTILFFIPLVFLLNKIFFKEWARS